MKSLYSEYRSAICRHKYGQEEVNPYADVDFEFPDQEANPYADVDFEFPDQPATSQQPSIDEYNIEKPDIHEQLIQPGDQIVEPSDEDILQFGAVLGEGEEDIGQIIYEFIPEIPDMQAYLYTKNDVSYNSLLYLKSLGYIYAQWQLSWYRGRILYDICDVYNGRFFTLQTLLDDANNHAAGGTTPGNWKGHNPYFPPAPVFAQSHPHCGCTLVCIKPRTIGEIPATAPGIPVSDNKKLVLEARRNLLNSLSDEYINSHTFIDTEKAQQLSMLTLPDMLAQSSSAKPYIDRSKDIWNQANKYQRNRHVTKWSPTYPNMAPNPSEFSELPTSESQASYISRSKLASNVFLPIEISESIMLSTPTGLLSPLAKGNRGFIIDRGEEASKVYLVQLNRTLLVPNTIITELKLRPSKYDSQRMYGGIFVYVEDMLGITFKVYGTKDKSTYALVYIPELNNMVEVHKWIVLEKQ